MSFFHDRFIWVLYLALAALAVTLITLLIVVITGRVRFARRVRERTAQTPVDEVAILTGPVPVPRLEPPVSPAAFSSEMLNVADE